MSIARYLAVAAILSLVAAAPAAAQTQQQQQAQAAAAKPAPAPRSQDPKFINFAGGWFDMNRQKNQAAEFRVEYHHDERYWIFKPIAGIMATTDNATYIYAGVKIDVYLGNRWVLTPSFAPGWYRRGHGLDLGYALEFRSQLDLAYRFDDRSRLGVSFGHMSNASIGDTNPGTESLMLNYSVPLGHFERLFR
jgi:hypothetical protein